MGIFSSITTSLSLEEKKLDSILKQAAKDASVKLIPTEDKGVYEVDVTLANGKPISYYGKLRYIYGFEDDEPYVNVWFASNAFENKEIHDSTIKDLVEWRRNEYGNQYNIIYGDCDENGICFVIIEDGCFSKIPAIPDKHDSLNYADIQEKAGEAEAERKFIGFLTQKISGYTSVMIKSLEYSLGSGHNWPCKKEEHDKNNEVANEVANKVAQGTRAAAGMLSSAFDKMTKKIAYPSTMKRILAEAVKQVNWELTPQEEKNAFQIGNFAEGCFFLKYSTDSKNPSVDIEFISREFENSEKTKEMGNTIENSGLLKYFKAYVNGDNTILFRKTIAIQNIDDEQTAASNIKDGIETLIIAVSDIKNKWQRWPTYAEVVARHREQAARKAAEERERKAKAAAARKAKEAERREKMIAQCKLNVAKLRVRVAECEAQCNSHRGDDYYIGQRDRAKTDLAKEEYKLQRLEAGEDLTYFI